MRLLRLFLPPVLLLLPVALACDKLLLTPVAEKISSEQQKRSGATGTIDTGWPWVYASHFDYQNASPPNTDLRFSSWPILAADIAVLLVPIAVAAWLLLAHYRRRGHWFTISLRGLLLMVTCAALVVGWWTYNTRQWGREECAYKLLVEFEASRSKPTYCGPQWLRRFLTDEQLATFYYADKLEVEQQVVDRDPWPTLEREFAKLRHIRALKVDIQPQQTIDWSAFRQLKSLTLRFKQIDDQLLAGIDAIPSLEMLNLRGCAVPADSNLKALEQLTELTVLWLPSRVTNRQISGLNSMLRLRELHVTEAEITDAFLDVVAKLPALESFDMTFSTITDAGVRRLLEFPKLNHIVLPERMKVSWDTVRLVEQLRGKGAEVQFGRMKN